MKKKQRLELSEKILNFLNTFAKKNDNGDFIGPDAFCLEKEMKNLQDPSVPLKEINIPNSEFFSGCYKKEGETIHDSILIDFKDLLEVSCHNCANQISVQYTFCPFCGFRNE